MASLLGGIALTSGSVLGAYAGHRAYNEETHVIAKRVLERLAQLSWKKVGILSFSALLATTIGGSLLLSAFATNMVGLGVLFGIGFLIANKIIQSDWVQAILYGAETTGKYLVKTIKDFIKDPLGTVVGEVDKLKKVVNGVVDEMNKMDEAFKQLILCKDDKTTLEILRTLPDTMKALNNSRKKALEELEKAKKNLKKAKKACAGYEEGREKINSSYLATIGTWFGMSREKMMEGAGIPKDLDAQIEGLEVHEKRIAEIEKALGQLERMEKIVNPLVEAAKKWDTFIVDNIQIEFKELLAARLKDQRTGEEMVKESIAQLIGMIKGNEGNLTEEEQEEINAIIEICEDKTFETTIRRREFSEIHKGACKDLSTLATKVHGFCKDKIKGLRQAMEAKVGENRNKLIAQALEFSKEDERVEKEIHNLGKQFIDYLAENTLTNKEKRPKNWSEMAVNGVVTVAGVAKFVSGMTKYVVNQSLEKTGKGVQLLKGKTDEAAREFDARMKELVNNDIRQGARDHSAQIKAMDDYLVKLNQLEKETKKLKSELSLTTKKEQMEKLGWNESEKFEKKAKELDQILKGIEEKRKVVEAIKEFDQFHTEVFEELDGFAQRYELPAHEQAWGIYTDLQSKQGKGDFSEVEDEEMRQQLETLHKINYCGQIQALKQGKMCKNAQGFSALQEEITKGNKARAKAFKLLEDKGELGDLEGIKKTFAKTKKLAKKHLTTIHNHVIESTQGFEDWRAYYKVRNAFLQGSIAVSKALEVDKRAKEIAQVVDVSQVSEHAKRLAKDDFWHEDPIASYAHNFSEMVTGDRAERVQEMQDEIDGMKKQIAELKKGQGKKREELSVLEKRRADTDKEAMEAISAIPLRSQRNELRRKLNNREGRSVAQHILEESDVKIAQLEKTCEEYQKRLDTMKQLNEFVKDTIGQFATKAKKTEMLCWQQQAAIEWNRYGVNSYVIELTEEELAVLGPRYKDAYEVQKEIGSQEEMEKFITFNKNHAKLANECVAFLNEVNVLAENLLHKEELQKNGIDKELEEIKKKRAHLLTELEKIEECGSFTRTCIDARNLLLKGISQSKEFVKVSPKKWEAIQAGANVGKEVAAFAVPVAVIGAKVAGSTALLGLKFGLGIGLVAGAAYAVYTYATDELPEELTKVFNEAEIDRVKLHDLPLEEQQQVIKLIGEKASKQGGYLNFAQLPKTGKTFEKGRIIHLDLQDGIATKPAKGVKTKTLDEAPLFLYKRGKLTEFVRTHEGVEGKTKYETCNVKDLSPETFEMLAGEIGVFMRANQPYMDVKVGKSPVIKRIYLNSQQLDKDFVTSKKFTFSRSHRGKTITAYGKIERPKREKTQSFDGCLVNRGRNLRHPRWKKPITVKK